MGLVYDLRLCLNHSEKTHGGEFQGLGPDRELKPILLFGSLIKIFGKGAVVFRDSPPDDLQIQPMCLISARRSLVLLRYRRECDQL